MSDPEVQVAVIIGMGADRDDRLICDLLKRQSRIIQLDTLIRPLITLDLLDWPWRIDNNRAENQLRVVALGRKNWLFAGSFEGARRAALLYSLVQSCTLAGAPPFDYLKDVLLRVATHPQRLIGQLTPKAWRETFGRHRAAA